MDLKEIQDDYKLIPFGYSYIGLSGGIAGDIRRNYNLPFTVNDFSPADVVMIEAVTIQTETYMWANDAQLLYGKDYNWYGFLNIPNEKLRGGVCNNNTFFNQWLLHEGENWLDGCLFISNQSYGNVNCQLESYYSYVAAFTAQYVIKTRYTFMGKLLYRRSI